MFCSNCGRELADDCSFCPGCGARVGGNSTVPTGNVPCETQGLREPSTLGPFLLGLILSIIGVIIAVVVYNDKYNQYTKDPAVHALIWSLIGMFIWIPIVFVLAFMLSHGL